MIKTIEMVVSLKVPDTTATTAFQTLQRIGFRKIKGIKRSDYFKLSFEGDAGEFKNKISKVDILVNANKHFFAFLIEKNADAKILVKNTDDDGSGLLSVLKNRLGFDKIKSVEKATLWELSIDADEKEKLKIAEKAAKELLTNENYQEFEIL
ncbi:phosphoribosylformylglycinamidine synthase subunit PurS [Candidatus Woesearchaeota archaeon]|nr:phosphoribosylformylglycinamidine synthase subunit PurS [Candidatus Woesearchaeota archaeon]